MFKLWSRRKRAWPKISPKSTNTSAHLSECLMHEYHHRFECHLWHSKRLPCLINSGTRNGHGTISDAYSRKYHRSTWPLLSFGIGFRGVDTRSRDTFKWVPPLSYLYVSIKIPISSISTFYDVYSVIALNVPFSSTITNTTRITAYTHVSQLFATALTTLSLLHHWDLGWMCGLHLRGAEMLNCERGSCTFRAITQGHKMLKTRAWQFVWTGIHNCLILWKWCLARCNKIQNSYGQSPLRHASLSENITPFPTYTISYYVACLSLVLTNHIASRIIGFSWSSLSELIKAHK